MRKDYRFFTTLLKTELLRTEGFSDHGYRFTESEEDPSDEEKIQIEFGRDKGITEAFSIGVESLYHRYEHSHDIGAVAQEILDELEWLQGEGFAGVVDKLTDYNSIRSRLFIRAINYERNKEILKDYVYRVVGDIALVLYVRGFENDKMVSSAKIRKSLLKIWGKEEGEVFEYALVNTGLLTPPRVYKWEKMLIEPGYKGENFMDMTRTGILNKGVGGNCISTVGMTNGAVSAFIPGVLRRISDLLESDLYLAFTSIHEVMVHSAWSLNPDLVVDVLKATIDECTPEKDFLSEKIYYYNREEGNLICLP